MKGRVRAYYDGAVDWDMDLVLRNIRQAGGVRICRGSEGTHID